MTQFYVVPGQQRFINLEDRTFDLNHTENESIYSSSLKTFFDTALKKLGPLQRSTTLLYRISAVQINLQVQCEFHVGRVVYCGPIGPGITPSPLSPECLSSMTRSLKSITAASFHLDYDHNRKHDHAPWRLLRVFFHSFAKKRPVPFVRSILFIKQHYVYHYTKEADRFN